GNIDWVDSTIHDTPELWSIRLFTYQIELNNGSQFPVTLPASSKADVTIRRAQLFKNIPANTKLCWTNDHNGNIQSGYLKVTYSGTIQKPITMKAVKIYPDGNLLKIEVCDQLKNVATESTPPLTSVEPAI